MTIQKELLSTAPAPLQVSGDPVKPLAVTVAKACELSGYGPTTIWALLKNGRLRAVRVDGIRRTTVDYGSLVRLLAPRTAEPTPRRRGRPRKLSIDLQRRLDEMMGATTRKPTL
jgi:hypothetical protein